MSGRKKIINNLYIADSINRLIDKGTQSGDFRCDLPAHAGDAECRHLFLNIYDELMVRKRFSEIGLTAYLKNKGFADILFEIGRDNSSVSRLRVYDKISSPDNFLIDTRLSETLFTPFKKFCELIDEKTEPCTFRMIVIEWIETINPKTNFTDERPQLPGQKKPGLGVLSYINKFLAVTGKDVSCDGFIKIPDHVHTAIMYSIIFMFVNPARQGYLRALRRDTEKYTLSDISWGFLTETIYDRDTGVPEKYFPAEQVLPISERLMEYFTSRKYASGVQSFYEKKGFRFDSERMQLLRKEWLKNKKLEDA